MGLRSNDKTDSMLLTSPQDVPKHLEFCFDQSTIDGSVSKKLKQRISSCSFSGEGI
jgi:hypothetical protein